MAACYLLDLKLFLLLLHLPNLCGLMVFFSLLTCDWNDPTSNFSDDLVLVVPCLLIISKFRPRLLIPPLCQHGFMSAVAHERAATSLYSNLVGFSGMTDKTHAMFEKVKRHIITEPSSFLFTPLHPFLFARWLWLLLALLFFLPSRALNYHNRVVGRPVWKMNQVGRNKKKNVKTSREKWEKQRETLLTMTFQFKHVILSTIFLLVILPPSSHVFEIFK